MVARWWRRYGAGLQPLRHRQRLEPAHQFLDLNQGRVEALKNLRRKNRRQSRCRLDVAGFEGDAVLALPGGAFAGVAASAGAVDVVVGVRSTKGDGDDVVEFWCAVVEGAFEAFGCGDTAELAAPVVSGEHLHGVNVVASVDSCAFGSTGVTVCPGASAFGTGWAIEPSGAPAFVSPRVTTGRADALSFWCSPEFEAAVVVL